jgi:hypothetical protein
MKRTDGIGDMDADRPTSPPTGDVEEGTDMNFLNKICCQECEDGEIEFRVKCGCTVYLKCPSCGSVIEVMIRSEVSHHCPTDPNAGIHPQSRRRRQRHDLN